MASDYLPVDTPNNEFDAFCDFLVGMKRQGTKALTPEQSVQEFRNHQAQMRQWNEKNLLSQQQSQRGEAIPLDDKAVLARLRTRLTQKGLTQKGLTQKGLTQEGLTQEGQSE